MAAPEELSTAVVFLEAQEEKLRAVAAAIAMMMIFFIRDISLIVKVVNGPVPHGIGSALAEYGPTPAGK